ncbi:hypothetical protein ABFX02_08G232800 [Erythranthe guttata]
MQKSRRRCESTSMGSIVLDLRPGFGLGPFTLGMPICEAFARMEQQPNIYDVVHVNYYDEEPLKLDIIISFPDHGFHLRFDPWSQRLRLIEIFDVKRVQMRYATSLIGGPSTLATFVAVYALFGPTYSGIYDKDRGVYTLFYPGLSFAFPIPSQYAEFCQNRAELPLEFPDRTTPVTCCFRPWGFVFLKSASVWTPVKIPATPGRFPGGKAPTIKLSWARFTPYWYWACELRCPHIVSEVIRPSDLFRPTGLSYHGLAIVGLISFDLSIMARITCRISVYDSSTDRKVGVGASFMKACVPPLPDGSLYMEQVQVKLGEELWFTVGGQHIPFGASPQDVWTELGRPCGIHQKQVDQMVIHSASDPRPRTTLCGDYFYNYFTRGFDILFDGQTHKIKKFVLHTNYPGHADFNSDMKCNFVICTSD